MVVAMGERQNQLQSRPRRSLAKWRARARIFDWD